MTSKPNERGPRGVRTRGEQGITGLKVQRQYPAAARFTERELCVFRPSLSMENAAGCLLGGAWTSAAW